jgi:hypothetical protein
MFKILTVLVSFAHAGSTVITIDDAVANIPNEYAQWAATEAQTS